MATTEKCPVAGIYESNHPKYAGFIIKEEDVGFSYFGAWVTGLFMPSHSIKMVNLTTSTVSPNVLWWDAMLATLFQTKLK